VELADRLGRFQAEADVEAVRKRLVRPGWDEGEQEAVVVADEEAALRLERRAEAEVALVEVAAGRRVAHPEVQVVEVHAPEHRTR
jgi:hypothetical protein